MNDNSADGPDNVFGPLERATRIIHDAPLSDGPPAELVRRAVASIERQERSSFRFRAIAAILIVGAMLAGMTLLLLSNGSGHLAMAEVARNAMRWRGVTFVDRSAIDGVFARVVMTDRAAMRLEQFSSDKRTSPSKVVIWNGESGEVLTLDHEKKQAIRMRQRPAERFDFYEWLKSIAAADGKRIGERHIQDRNAVGYQVTHVAPGSDGSTTMQSVVWLDEQTRLPVRIEYDFAGKRAMIDEIRFDLDPSDLAEERFSLTIPQGYAVSDMGGVAARDLRPPPTTREAAELLTIKPAVGIGPLKFGDSRDRIIEVLGPPEDGDERNLRYPSKGIAVLFEPGVGLLNVVAHTRKMARPFAINDFAGTTDRGIGMGATREQIEAVYGKPDEVQQAGVQIVLRYAKLDMWLTLNDGKLGYIWITIPREKVRALYDKAKSPQTTTRPRALE